MLIKPILGLRGCFEAMSGAKITWLIDSLWGDCIKGSSPQPTRTDVQV